MTIESVTRTKIQVAQFFDDEGWNIVSLRKQDVNMKGVKKGKIFRCADDGYYSENCPSAPAYFGATDGIAALLNETDSIEIRYQKADERIRSSDFLPGTHGDTHSGDVFGCAFKRLWIEGKFSSFLPPLSELEAKIMKVLFKLHHHNLERQHTPEGLLINLEPESTVIPEGKYLVNDLWYLLSSLGFQLSDVLHLSSDTGKHILPVGKRRLYLI